MQRPPAQLLKANLPLLDLFPPSSTLQPSTPFSWTPLLSQPNCDFPRLPINQFPPTSAPTAFPLHPKANSPQTHFYHANPATPNLRLKTCQSTIFPRPKCDRARRHNQLPCRLPCRLNTGHARSPAHISILHRTYISSPNHSSSQLPPKTINHQGTKERVYLAPPSTGSNLLKTTNTSSQKQFSAFKHATTRRGQSHLQSRAPSPRIHPAFAN